MSNLSPAARAGHRRLRLDGRGRPFRLVLVGVKHTKAAPTDVSLSGDGQLKGISAAGTGTKKEPKYVALQVVIERMNDLFGAESFADSQVRGFVQGLVQRLLADPDLVKQTKVNSKKQFMESQDF